MHPGWGPELLHGDDRAKEYVRRFNMGDACAARLVGRVGKLPGGGRGLLGRDVCHVFNPQ